MVFHNEYILDLITALVQNVLQLGILSCRPVVRFVSLMLQKHLTKLLKVQAGSRAKQERQATMYLLFHHDE